MALLEVKDLTAAYGGIQALRGVSLTVEEGQIVAVLGANGAGKSTLLKCISSVMKPTGGTIEFLGKPVSQKPYEVVEAGLVQVPEARQIFAKLTVAENLRVGSGLRKDADGIRRDMERVYTMFPRLKEREKQYGGLLSGGEQQMLAIGRGIALTRQLAAEGYGLVATGEMGIGNTTTSSAVAAVLLAQPVQTMTGRGAGLSDAGLARKVDAIRRGIACNNPDSDDALDVLSKLGGFDIAGLCGMFLGGALAGVPVLMDGFISGVAALCAVRLCPAAAKAVFASHCSTEPAARLVLEALGKTPLLTAGLHLGEGTGAVASIPLWDMALAVYEGCYSFAEGGIVPYTPQC